MKTYNIRFPSVHGANGGAAFEAEADAPTEAHAYRAVLEACAAQGVPLQFVVLANIHDLVGAKLDGLKLENCRVENVNFSGVSLRGATFTDTVLDHVLADSGTCLDEATLEGVRILGCSLNGASAQRMQGRALYFADTTAIGLDVRHAAITGMRRVRCDLSSWRVFMAFLNHVESAPQIIEQADATENEKATARTLVHSAGNRVAAQTFFDALEAQDAKASA